MNTDKCVNKCREMFVLLMKVRIFETLYTNNSSFINTNLL